MKAPQIIMIAMLAISFGVNWKRHGKPKKGNENAWVALVGGLILVSLLWWGGFWS